MLDTKTCERGERMRNDDVGSVQEKLLLCQKKLEKAEENGDEYEIRGCRNRLEKVKMELQELQDMPRSLPDTHFYNQYE